MIDSNTVGNMGSTPTSSADNPYIRAFQRIYASVEAVWSRFYAKECLFFELIVYLSIVFNDRFELAEFAF